MARSGKGGGKTTIAAALTKILAGFGGIAYAIDTKPDALAPATGVSLAEMLQDQPVVEMCDAIRAKSGGGLFIL
ncbi:MAG: hypothetical protein MJA84_12380 [Firmicutes bacterium]|nr:hypothetical protein [Bacillota bacterium]